MRTQSYARTHPLPCAAKRTCTIMGTRHSVATRLMESTVYSDTSSFFSLCISNCFVAERGGGGGGGIRSPRAENEMPWTAHPALRKGARVRGAAAVGDCTCSVPSFDGSARDGKREHNGAWMYHANFLERLALYAIIVHIKSTPSRRERVFLLLLSSFFLAGPSSSKTQRKRPTPIAS